jgi:hypothetical protein
MSMMLKSVHLSHFTVFEDAAFDFSPRLNILIGDNGSGRTHIPKACYPLLSVCANGKKESSAESPAKTYLQPARAGKLRTVFRPADTGLFSIYPNFLSVYVCSLKYHPLQIPWTVSNAEYDLNLFSGSRRSRCANPMLTELQIRGRGIYLVIRYTVSFFRFTGCSIKNVSPRKEYSSSFSGKEL